MDGNVRLFSVNLNNTYILYYKCKMFVSWINYYKKSILIGFSGFSGFVGGAVGYKCKQS
jgi:hypothetical protein